MLEIIFDQKPQRDRIIVSHHALRAQPLFGDVINDSCRADCGNPHVTTSLVVGGGDEAGQYARGTTKQAIV